MTIDFKPLEDILNIHFSNLKYLKQAFTHSSYINEVKNKNYEDNERLEFLGDAVLELTVSDYLFQAFPDLSEGQLTKLRAAIVCEPSLVEIAESLNFGDYVLLGKGEECTGGRRRPALLADVFEAFIGALYLEKGIEEVKKFLEVHVFPKIDHGLYSKSQDYKSQLQEYIQQKNLGNIVYKIVDEIGPAHDIEFHVEVVVDKAVMGKGIGKSKKEAEQRAAQKALKNLGYNK